MLRRSLMVAVLSLATLTGLLTAPASAAVAAPPAELSRTLYLTIDPPTGSRAEKSRDIVLAAGTYSWNANLLWQGRPIGRTGRSIDLAAGTYHWVVYVYAPMSDDVDYQLRSSLQKAGSPKALIETDVLLDASGNHTMESFLQCTTC